MWASGETYSAGDGTGVNFFGNNEGYVSLTVVAPDGWSGCGFNVGAANISKMKELRDAIVASPDDFYLHLAMKATTTGNHQFYTFAEKAASFAVGTATIEAGLSLVILLVMVHGMSLMCLWLSLLRHCQR